MWESGLGGFIVYHMNCNYLSSGDFQRVVGEEVFTPRVRVFLFHNICGVMCGMLVFLSLLYLALYIAMLV